MADSGSVNLTTMNDKDEQKQTTNDLSFSIDKILSDNRRKVHSSGSSYGNETSPDSGISSSPELRHVNSGEYLLTPLRSNDQNLLRASGNTPVLEDIRKNLFLQGMHWKGNVMTATPLMDPYPILSEQSSMVTSSEREQGFSRNVDSPPNASENVDPELQSNTSSKPREKRFRTSFTQNQLDILEKEFAKSRYLVGAARKEFATFLGLSNAQVKVWFQNRRIKWKQERDRAQTAGQSVANE